MAFGSSFGVSLGCDCERPFDSLARTFCASGCGVGQRNAVDQRGAHRAASAFGAAPVLAASAGNQVSEQSQREQGSVQHRRADPRHARMSALPERCQRWLPFFSSGWVTMLTLVMPACFTASITVAKAPKGTSWSARIKTD